MSNTGLMVGRLLGQPRPSLIGAVAALLNPRVSSEAACRKFFWSVVPGTPWGRDSVVTLRDNIHTLVCAPTGLGKGQSIILPQLFTRRESCLVCDIKGGENAIQTAEYRRRVFGHRCLVLDPFKITGLPTAFLNPLDTIPADHPECIDMCFEMADAMVVRSDEEKDRHWNDSASILIATVLAAVVHFAAPDDRSLITVRATLADPARTERAIEALIDSGNESLARLGNQAKFYRDKELSSVQTTVNRHLSFLNSPLIAEHLRVSSCDPADLRSEGVTAYMVLPPHAVQNKSGLLRLWATTFYRAIVNQGLGEDHLVHLILDETASLGRLDMLESALATGRAYGLRIQMYLQSLPQLEKCFPHGQHLTVLSNCTKVFFGTNDLPTAETISAMIGDFTLPITAGGTNRGDSRSRGEAGGPGSVSHSTGESENWNLIARRVFKPEELLKISPRVAFVFAPNTPPVMTWLTRWYEDPNMGAPTKLERFTTVTGRLIGALVLFALSIVLAVAVTSAVARLAAPRSVQQKFQPVPGEVRDEKGLPVKAARGKPQGGGPAGGRYDGGKGGTGKQ